MFHLWQLLNPRAPEEILVPDDLPRQIAEAGAQRRYSNAAFAEADEMRGQLAEERRHRRRIAGVATLVAADRLALHRTIAFIEQRWRSGGEVDQTFTEANKVRKEEFDSIVSDPAMDRKFLAAVEDMPNDVNEARKIMVDAQPAFDRHASRSRPRSRPRG